MPRLCVESMSEVPQSRVKGTLLVFLYTSEFCKFLENVYLYGYVNDSTLIVVLPTPGARSFVAQSNAGKTRPMVASESHTVHPISLSLIIDGTLLKEYGKFGSHSCC